MSKYKILIVGGFPPPHKNIYGGIVSSCRLIANSSLSEKFNLITIDSTQRTNPPPNLLTRGLFAIKRIFVLLYKLNFKKPAVALIFSSDAFSAIEKGCMVWLAKLHNCSPIIFPRTGELIDQTNRSKTFESIIKFLFTKSTFFFCQGEQWNDYAIQKLNIEPSKVVTIHNWTATDELIKIGKNNFISNQKQ